MGNILENVKNQNQTVIDPGVHIKDDDDVIQCIRQLEDSTSVKMIYFASFDLSKFLDPLCSALERNHSILNLKLGQNNFSMDTAWRIGASLSCNIQIPLKYLDLSYNALGNNFVSKISPFLIHNTSLEQLYLINCDITEDGAHSLQEVLQKNRNLECLQLSHNTIGPQGGMYLLDGITDNSCVCLITLSTSGVPQGIQGKITERTKANRITRQIQYRSKLYNKIQ
jgi:hypothetical protein